MKLSLKSALAGATALALAGGGLVLGASPAFAAAPAWEPDPNARGAVVFYDAAGTVLTGGSNLSHLADFLAVTTTGSTNATKANLLFALPDHTKATGAWTTGAGSASTNYPNASAPAPITGPGFAKPVVTLGATDADLASFISGSSPDTTAGYANVYQVRVKDSGPGGAGSGAQYWETNVLVSGSTWSVLYPDVVTTTTSLTLSPATSPQAHGTAVTLNTTVSPAATGTLRFFDGATPLGSVVNITPSSLSASFTDNPADGAHVYKAVFTPAGGTAVQGSTSPNRSMTINAPQVGTSLALGVSPASAPQYAPVTFTANASEADAPTTTGLAGTVTFLEGTTTLGTQSVNDGTAGEYKFTSTALAQGTHAVHAVFAPANTGYATSTSPDVTVTVTAPACPGSPDPSGATCSDDDTVKVTVNPGSLTITTPYTATNPFVLPDMVLNPAATLLVSSARFPAASDPQITVHSSLAGDPNWTASVTATDLTGGTASHKINGENLGLTGGTVVSAVPPTRTVSFTDNPAGNGVAVGATTGAGLKGGPHTFAQSTNGGNGSVTMYGTLSLNAPTSTQADTYTGTITFSVV
jgi:hypothetical protein